MPMTIRALVPADADQLGALHVRIWRETYAGLLPEAALANLDVAQRVQMWRDLLSGGRETSALGGFNPDGILAGWIWVCPARDEDAPAPTELAVLNVVADHHGSGLARLLLERGSGSGAAYLWVVEGNDRAVAFYRKCGFELDGAARDEPEGNRDLRMVRGIGNHAGGGFAVGDQISAEPTSAVRMVA